MYMIMLVLDDTAYQDQILAAWAGLGATGITALESTGLHPHHREHIPMRYTFSETPAEAVSNSTLLALVKDETTARACLAAAEQIVGDLDEPNGGVFSAWPVTIVKGNSAPGAA
jgi:hypothetical protein